MNPKNSTVRQDVVEVSVNHQIFCLANSAASPSDLETLLASELDHDLIAWPRQYLESYLDSDVAGRIPLDPEQLQDVLEAAFDRDAELARDYLEELNAQRSPKQLGESTLALMLARMQSDRLEYELLFDPTAIEDLRHLTDKLDKHALEKQKASPQPTFKSKPDIDRRESTTLSAVHQPGSGVVELHDKATGTEVRKLLGGESPLTLQSALHQMAPGARMENAQTDSGTYRGDVLAETEKSLIQQITPHAAIVHRKELLDSIPAVGEHVRIIYSSEAGRVVSVRERSKSQELGR